MIAQPSRDANKRVSPKAEPPRSSNLPLPIRDYSTSPTLQPQEKRSIFANTRSGALAQSEKNLAISSSRYKPVTDPA